MRRTMQMRATKLSRAILTGLVAPVLLGACQQAEPRGDATAASETFPRVVSLNPCLDAILVETARPAQVLALSHYSHDPAASSIPIARARQFAATGGTAEEVLALAPDIVLAGQFIAPATRSALERGGLRVETFGSPATIGESREQVERIARLVGNRDAAGPLLERIGQPSGSVASLPEAPSVLLWQAGEIVPGEATLIAGLLREAGFSSHSARLGLDQADRVALEQVIADPPDILLVAGMSAGQQHPVLEALANTHMAEFDPRLFYCGGPAIQPARAELAAIRADYESARQ
ncbi:ABC transporter substrate-binding protein [Qipengyuania nanhaisediminis]|uniref:ABC transporter substrate-binding protein n=1 Tax=Qipengyuania nanhaisediminis TaxID=604088 RepID=UPI0038B375EE